MNRPGTVIPLVIAVSLLGAAGQTLLKSVLNGLPPGSNPLSAVRTLLGTAPFYGGMLLVACGTALWLLVLSQADLSYVTPFVGVGMVTVMLFSAIFLHEPVGAMRIGGFALILAGALLVAKS